jgi:1,4-alpha-glucan branching enzyme
VNCREQQLAWAAERLDVAPHVTSPYDAELFGHWWFEGPWFLEQVLREAATKSHVAADTPSAYLKRIPVQQIAEPSPSSWGENGYFGVWLNPRNAWMHRGLQRGERQLQHIVDQWAGTSTRADRALRQAARELLLAQSSDWAFIVTTDTAVQYAEQRTRQHLANLDALVATIEANEEDGENLDALVAALEDRSPIFPHVRPELWASDR